MRISRTNRLRTDELGGVLGILVTVALLIAVGVGCVFYVFGQIINPNEIGLRQNYFSIPGIVEEGYSERGLRAGLHWKIPGVSTIHLLPRDFQIINFNKKAYPDAVLNMPQLEIPTTDGSKVKTDLTLIVRLFEEPVTFPEPPKRVLVPEGEDVPLPEAAPRSHGGPRELVNNYRTKPAEQLRLLASFMEEAIKNSLSMLSTTDYYNPVLREHSALLATEQINEKINPDGIQLWGTLIRRYVYSERNIDDAIFNKNLQEATEKLNAAERALEQARAKTEMTRANWDAQIADLRVEGEQEKAVITSEADRYEVEKTAIGDRSVQEAYAEVDKAKNRVLTDTPGADVYIAREMTPLLSTLEGGVVTDIDPFNVDAWVGKLISGDSKHRSPALGK